MPEALRDRFDLGGEYIVMDLSEKFGDECNESLMNVQTDLVSDQVRTFFAVYKENSNLLINFHLSHNFY